MRPNHKPTHTPKFPLAAGLVLGTTLAFAGKSVFAATAAGTVLSNIAKVTYEDSAGNQYEAESNEVVVTVAQVYGASLGADKLVATGSAGQTVYVTHTLRNEGNGSDTYHLSIGQFPGADAIDFTSAAVYRDGAVNGVGANGRVDSGELLLADLNGAGAVITLEPGAFAELVVALAVPTGAADGATAEYSLSARAEEGSGGPVADSVDDSSSANGVDGLEGTNQGRVTVVGDAVLNISSSAVHDSANHLITYTVDVSNTGNADATDVVVFNGLPQGTTLVPGSVTASGLINSGDLVNGGDATSAQSLQETNLTGSASYDLNGDGDTADATEAALGTDLDGDGVIGSDTVSGIYAVDAVLPANTTVRVSFTVAYDPASITAGTEIESTAFLSGDTNSDTDTQDSGEIKVANTNSVVVGANRAVQVRDTAIGTAAGANDGGDDDGLANDVQTVDQVPQGALVVFEHTVTNAGNGTDTFELSVINDGGAAWVGAGGALPAALGAGKQCDGTAASAFPNGTTFSFTDASGNVLTNTNASGSVDTGPLTGGAGRNVIVRAQLPADATGNGEYCASLRAVSAADPAVSDHAVQRLGAIIGSDVDIANTDTTSTPGIDVDAWTDGASTTFAAAHGQTIVIPVSVENDSDAADSFTLTAGSSWNGTALGALYEGWTVVFKDATGKVVNNTGLLPPNTSAGFTAHVSIPGDLSLSSPDYRAADVDGNGSVALFDANGDGDGDYPLFLRVVSGSGTGAADLVLDAVDVVAVESVTLSPDGADSVSPGGSVSYSHTLSNTGNTLENVQLQVSNSNELMNALVLVDSTGNGVPDSDWSSLSAGANVFVTDAAGTIVARALVNDGGNVALPLQAGDELLLETKVFASTAAAAGATDTATVSASYAQDGANTNLSAKVYTTVVLAQVEPVKTVAADIDCNGVADGAFAKNLATRIPPGGCVIWKITATNRGTDDALNVVIHDSVPAYTRLVANSLKSCTGSACTPVVSGNEIGDGVKVSFPVGTGANASEGGTLVSGAAATALFSTQVE